MGWRTDQAYDDARRQQLAEEWAELPLVQRILNIGVRLVVSACIVGFLVLSFTH